MKPAYYNEIDKFAAQWLRNLIAAGHIAPGDVDERSIEDVHPSDLKPYTQCHFFAGVGVWSYALRRSGWPDDRPVWTGSCPCQPFSAAGAGAGFADERHLWPAFFHLIEQCRPPVVFGEQVASRDANPWIDLVQDDLEGVGYGVGAVPFPSAGVGAPHIRDRLYWMAYADEGRRGRRPLNGQRQRDRPAPGWIEDAGDTSGRGSVCGLEHSRQHDDAGQGAAANTWHTKTNRSSDQSGRPGIPSFRMADSNHHGRSALPLDQCHDAEHHAEPCSESIGMGNANGHRARRDGGSLCGSIPEKDREHSAYDADASSRFGGLADTIMQQRSHGQSEVSDEHDSRGWQQSAAEASGLCIDSGRSGPTNGLWSAADWLLCRDGKWRPVEPGFEQMADGSSSSLGRVCADAIEEIEREVNEWEIRYQAIAAEGLLRVWRDLQSQALCEREIGRFSGVQSPPVLLAFLRQLTEQGWRFSDAMACSRSEASEILLRVMQFDGEAACTPLRRELAEQLSGKPSDPLRELSSLLAHYAAQCWGEACRKKAGAAAFPLTHNATARAGRLKAYGNAINAEAAQVFIEAAMSCMP